MHNTSRTIHQAAFDPDILRQHDFRAIAEYDNLVQVLSLLVRSIPRPTRPSVPCVDGNHRDLQISQLLIVELIHNPVILQLAQVKYADSLEESCSGRDE